MTDGRRGGEHPGITADFRALFDEHVSYVFGALRRLGVPDEDRDDVTQEVFMTVHALLDDYDRGRPFRPWAFGIAYRIALRHRRKTAKDHARSETVDRDVLDRLPADDTGAERAVAAREDDDAARALVREAIDAVEIHRRAVFIMKEMDGVPMPEIAEALGIPLNTAYSRARLAREDFRAAVQRRRARAGPRKEPR